ncbi:MAG: Rid family detoxifying hydrolase [Candidatus Berkiella sp.]
MSLKVIHSSSAPSAVGPYSQAIQAGNLIFLSGLVGLDPKTSDLVSGGFHKELQQIFNNLQVMLIAANATINQIAKITVYLTSMNDFSVLNEMMRENLKEPFPARTTVMVAALPKNAVVEFDVVVCV